MDLEGMHILKQVAAYLKTDKIELEKVVKLKNSILPDRSCGVIWIITLLTEQNKPALCGRDNLEECVIRQWLEYIMIKFLRHCDTDDTVHKLLGDLNDILSDRVYFVAHKLSVADVVLYYVLYPILVKLAIKRKRNYVHICRWFDHIQQDPEIRQENNLLLFPGKSVEV